MKTYRVIVVGRGTLLERSFDREPLIGDVFQMDDGAWYRIHTITNASTEVLSPDWVIGAAPTNLHAWVESSSI